MSDTAGNRGKVAVLTFCGLGLAPVAPGTFGTLGGVLLAIPIVLIPGVPGWLGLLAAAALAVALGVALGGFAERHFDCKDPGQVVIDEVAGYLVTVAAWDLAFGRPLTFAGHCAAFLLFRAADILKPPPGRWLEQLPGGWGVMLDDVVLALYSGAALCGLGWLGFTWL
ncbi:MAG: phosphatidylglycerophosphatase A [Planctomycetes bacterium]|nr:phosphatidylglycerophosphatase A [Planctomycetota bacterium]